MLCAFDGGLMDALNGKGSRSNPSPGRAMALGVVITWIGLLGWLTFHTEKPDIEWSRLLTVLSSLEAVAFAAAGALFGTTVQKRRVQEAQEQAQKAGRATEAEKRSAANEQSAANGRALAVAVKSTNETWDRFATWCERRGRELSAGKLQEPTADDLWEIANQALPWMTLFVGTCCDPRCGMQPFANPSPMKSTRSPLGFAFDNRQHPRGVVETVSVKALALI